MPTDTLKDLLEEKKGFPVRHDLLENHSRVKMVTSHRDAHIYIFPQWIMQFVKENDHLETIGEDVIGWWAKAGWQKGLSTKLGLDEILRRPESDNGYDHTNNDTRKPTLGRKPADEPNPLAFIKTPKVDDSGKNPFDTAAEEVSVPPVIAYTHPSTPGAPIIRRVDTTRLLLQISLQLAKLPSIEEVGSADAASPFAHARKVAYPEGVKPRTTITKADSLVADNVTVQEKTSIKECVIGANCQIGEGAKLSQCLLMDGVVVGKNCKLTKCVLGRRSELGEGCTLTDCEVQENLLVEPKTEAKEEKFMSSSGLEATKEELDAYDDEDNDDEDDGSGGDNSEEDDD